MVTLDSINLKDLSPEKLGELLIEAKKAYYTGGKPIMDDHTFDTLEEILRQKLPNHRIFTKVGNTNFDTGFEKKPHIMPMGSQNKVTSFNDLVHYFELKKINIPEFVIQPKCDGISLEIIYKDGQLIDAITRGDGVIGDSITQNVVKMKNFVPHPDNFSGSVRCEIMVTEEDFKKLPETYSNPRNAASGLSQRLDSLYSEYCSLYAVDLFFPIPETEKINLLKSLGFTTVDSFTTNNFSQIENIYQKFLTNRSSLPFEIDGLVIKINDHQTTLDLGIKNNRPKFQVAYKFPSSSDSTQIKNITWQVGPMGSITPVAELEPIELSGAIVTFASLGNYDLIKEKNINIGDIVEVSRRGDVIPHIEKVITKVNSGHVLIPTHCPSCHSSLITDHKLLSCPNLQNCPAQILGSLNLFCHTLDIKGLSDKTIQKLYLSKKITLPGDFYKLVPSDIATLDNLGEISAQNIIIQIHNKKTLTLKQIFDSAATPNFSGARIQQLITAGFDTPEKILNITTDQLLALKGFQITLAKKIVDGINLRKIWIESIITQTSTIYDLQSKSLNNQIFCITGSLSQPRKDIENLIESNGGKISSSVSTKTNYLICNEPSNSDKYQTALALGVKIITEDDFQKLL